MIGLVDGFVGFFFALMVFIEGCVFDGECVIVLIDSFVSWFKIV